MKEYFMKALLLLIIFMTIIQASDQMMVDSATPLTSYNHRMSVSMKKKSELKRLAKIDKEQAQKIATASCKEPAQSLKLTHQGQLLYYRVYTEHYTVTINALDGSVISKKSKR